MRRIVVLIALVLALFILGVPAYILGLTWAPQIFATQS